MIELVSKKILNEINYIKKNLIDTTEKGAFIRVYFCENIEQYRYHDGVEKDIYDELEKKLVTLFQCIKGNTNENVLCFSYEESFWDICNYAKDKCKIDYKKEFDFSGVKTNEEFFLFQMFTEALKYKTFPIFFIKKLKYAIVPTDHLDVFIYGTVEDICELERFLKTSVFNKTFCTEFHCQMVSQQLF